jgi:molybdopterin-binding protein
LQIYSASNPSPPSHRLQSRFLSIRILPLPSAYNNDMTLSARNKLRGKIQEIVLGDVMAHVVIQVGDNLIESVITRRSADELKLKKGDAVSAVVKATEVMIQKD